MLVGYSNSSHISHMKQADKYPFVFSDGPSFRAQKPKTMASVSSSFGRWNALPLAQRIYSDEFVRLAAKGYNPAECAERAAAIVRSVDGDLAASFEELKGSSFRTPAGMFRWDSADKFPVC